MNSAVRRVAVVGLLVFSTACQSSGPTAPTAAPALLTPTPSPPTNQPLSGPSRTFSFAHELASRVSYYTTRSRFVLYDNGAFVLQYVGGGEYRGGYDDANGSITFAWEGWSVAGPWGASGTLKGDSLTVHYNSVMQLTDFEDAVYVLTP